MVLRIDLKILSNTRSRVGFLIYGRSAANIFELCFFSTDKCFIGSIKYIIDLVVEYWRHA